MWIWVEPLDVLFFRDSKPFSAGENFRAASAFPPTVQPLLGAIRSKVLVERDVGFGEYGRACRKPEEKAHKWLQKVIDTIGKPESVEQLDIRGPLLARRIESTVALDRPAELEAFFPMPLDVLAVKNGENLRMAHAAPRPIAYPVKANPARGCGNVTVELAPLALDSEAKRKERVLPAADCLLKALGIAAYLRDETPAGELVETSELWDREARTGIQTEQNRTVREGMYYTAEFVRMRKKYVAEDATFHTCGFLMRIDGLPPEWLGDSPGLLALGGERRAASFCVEDRVPATLTNLLDEDRTVKLLERRREFKLYLTTSIAFPSGWYPSFLKAVDGELVGSLGELQFRLVGAAVGKSEYFGGWDLVHRMPKPTRRAVPAGSVYYFEKIDGVLTEQEARQLHTAFQFQSLANALCDVAAKGDKAESIADEGKRGYGTALLGTWKRN